MASRISGHVIVCGVDHLGIRTVRELRLRDERVVVIAPAGLPTDVRGLDEIPVVTGDPRAEATLGDAGIAAATALVLTLEDDHANLDIALTAQDLNPSLRIVIRMFDAELGSHLRELFPDAVVLSSSALAAPAFVSAALDGEAGSGSWRGRLRPCALTRGRCRRAPAGGRDGSRASRPRGCERPVGDLRRRRDRRPGTTASRGGADVVRLREAVMPHPVTIALEERRQLGLGGHRRCHART